MKGKHIMKRFIALLLCFVLVFALCACAKEQTNEPEETEFIAENTEPTVSNEPEAGTACIVNPCTEYDSLDEINDVVGGNLVRPAVMGVGDKSYTVIDSGDCKIAEYRFNVAGFDYVFRCANETKDISGVYMGGEGTAFADGTTDEMQINCGSEYKCARWFNGDMQYVLTLADAENAMSQDIFESIASELMGISSAEL